MLTIEDVKNNGWVVYEYVRGSHCHGIATEKSDVDLGGVFIIPEDYLLGLRENYVDQVADEKGDRVYYELTRWAELLLKSNPTVLESLFVDDEFVTVKPHGAIKPFFDHRDEFLSKDCFNSLVGYSKEQVAKANNYKRYTATPVKVRLSPLEFCFTANDKQGTIPITDWLKENGLNQSYCGLVHLPNMTLMHGVYYDWAEHIRLTYSSEEDFMNHIMSRDENTVAFVNFAIKAINAQIESTNKVIGDCLNTLSSGVLVSNEKRTKIENTISECKSRLDNLCSLDLGECFWTNYNKVVPKGYHGIVNPNETSTEIRKDSIQAGDACMCLMHYNKNGYEVHCKQYKHYKEWEAKRNPVRYEENKGYFFDAKNMCECARLILTGIDLARTNTLVINRKHERDFLLDIKHHKKSYDEIMDFIKSKQDEFDRLVAVSTLPEHPDPVFINKLILEARREYYNNETIFNPEYLHPMCRCCIRTTGGSPS